MAFPRYNIKLHLIDEPLYDCDNNIIFQSLILPITKHANYFQNMKCSELYIRRADLPPFMQRKLPKKRVYIMLVDFLPSLTHLLMWYVSQFQERGNIDNWVNLITKTEKWTSLDLCKQKRKKCLILTSALCMSLCL